MYLCTLKFVRLWLELGQTVSYRLLSNLPIKSIVLCAHDLNSKRISLMDAVAVALCISVSHFNKTQSNFQQMRHSPINLYTIIIIRYKYCDFIFFVSSFRSQHQWHTMICPIIDL